MAIFKVEGGHRLHGSITPQGAKNEALQILCATLLTPERVTVHNIPQILDVMQLIELLRRMGVEVEQLAEDTYSFCAREIDFDYLRTEDYRQRCTRLRGSVMLIGPMLARFGVGYIPKPGGDKIGRRRLDTHFLGFQKLGAKFDFDIADEFFMVEGRELKGTYMLLDEASVTGTANIVMAAVMAKGFTTIYNAACEPYLQQLCKMLNRMGARISGIASNLLTIEGVESLGGTEHTLLPDMIEVGSFIGMAAMNQSELTIRHVSFENPLVLRRQADRHGGADHPLRPAPRHGHRPRPPHPPARYAHDLTRHTCGCGAADRCHVGRRGFDDPEYRPDRPRLQRHRRASERPRRTDYPHRRLRIRGKGKRQRRSGEQD